MTNRFTKTIRAIAIIVVFTLAMTSPSFGATAAQDQPYLDEKIKELESYIKLIHDNYKDDVDFETLINGAFVGATKSLGDPYSVYFSNPAAGLSFVETATGEYEGIGVIINTNIDGLCEVVTVIYGGPAEYEGIKIGDIIIEIDGESVAEKNLLEISNMLKGEAGTTAAIVVKRGSAELFFAITRERVHTTSVYSEMLEGDIGYIRLAGFNARGSVDFRGARNKLRKAGASSLIIDMRGNSGGLMGTAESIADMLLEKGVIVHYTKNDEVFSTKKARNKEVNEMPIIILVNERSASAAEVLAGAMQDNKAAVIVGTQTYGKGAAQVVGRTKDGHNYRLSTFYFLTPDKHVIDGKGITPDYIVENKLGEERVEALELYKEFAPFAENTKPIAGDVGLDVFAAQQRLLLLGYDLSLTAKMDAATVAAIKKLQKQCGLYDGGVLDFTTKSKIEEVTLSYINNDSAEDLQLKKAIELLKN